MTTRIAIPVAGSVLSSHFGQSEKFAIFDIDTETSTITGRSDLAPPHHAPGAFPSWLSDHKVTLVIAGGMGDRARSLFTAKDIQVVLGAAPGDPETTVQDFLAGRLVAGENACDHDAHPHTCDH